MPVLVEIRDSVAVITLDWPQHRNSLTPARAAEVVETLSATAADAGIWGIVLTGNGAFCTGGDLESILAIVDAGADAIESTIYGQFQQLTRAVIDCPVPVVAAIDGAAIGVGLDLALSCDDRFIGPEGWISQRWGALGLIPGAGGLMFLEGSAPGALWALLSGDDRVGPTACAAMGLAHVAEESALTSALAMLDGIVRLPRDTVLAYVSLARRKVRDQLDEHLATCLALQSRLITSAEFRARATRRLGRGR